MRIIHSYDTSYEQALAASSLCSLQTRKNKTTYSQANITKQGHVFLSWDLKMQSKLGNWPGVDVTNFSVDSS